jgi:hypothetical protein
LPLSYRRIGIVWHAVVGMDLTVSVRAFKVNNILDALKLPFVHAKTPAPAEARL